MSRRPVKVVVVGGGTAGWMTAAGLVGLLRPDICSVRLIESDEIGIVGVGEATLPHIKDFNDRIGVIESDMMRRVNAVFKLGIEFRDWGYLGSNYHHPFGEFGRARGGAAFQHRWLRAARAGSRRTIEDFCYPIAAARQNRFDFPSSDTTAVSSTYTYAYHIDAGLYARYLRGFAEPRGVQRTEGKMVGVDRDPETGDIAAVRMESGDRVTGDLFVDCTGFRALLIGGALESTWESWSKWLPCDRAFAVPCDRSDDFTPYTRVTAREAGWQWRIPLQHRTGNGHVFSSAFIDEERAAATLMANLDGPAMDSPRLLKFEAGRRPKSWRGNCVAIGLASGFLEPLESTSIYLIQSAVQNLVKLFPGTQVDPALANEFNRLADVEYSRVRDFLILHYHANTREDSELWRYCRAMAVPESLSHRIALFRHAAQIEQYGDGLFQPPSWLAVLLGQGVRPEAWHPLADNAPLDAIEAELDELATRIRDRVAMMPSHAEFVADYCPSDAAIALGAA